MAPRSDPLRAPLETRRAPGGMSLKVVMIGPAPGEGGIPSHLGGLSLHLQRRGHQLKILNPSDLPPVGATIRYLARLMDRVDVVHVQGLKDFPSLVATCAAARTHVGASFVTAHGLGEGFWRRGHLHYVEWRGVLNRMDALISVSEHVRLGMTRLTGRSRNSFTIYNGVDTDIFRPTSDTETAKRRLGLSGSYVLLCVGRLSPEKGVSVAIDSFPIIARSIPRARLVICGNGPMKSRLKEQSRSLGIEGAVDFKGSIPIEQIPSYYEAADVVVVPSIKEALGIVNLEAMSMMKPVVASRVGGIPEVVINNETGLLVPPSDPASLAEAVIKLCADPETADRFGRNGRRLVGERFTWERIAGETERVYAEVLRRKSGWGEGQTGET